ncbi:Hypothetical predicted protein [Octopus vulgaris]|uniref:Uncharacterized protein n=1 Tax=Octopus vulgaris TaxID=6645 RepID=A0AA36B4R9_OCTVU|nr:Hypothetical predicted protein [Octopus vulgaris]
MLRKMTNEKGSLDICFSNRTNQVPYCTRLPMTCWVTDSSDDDLESTTKSLTDADKSSSSKVSIRDLRKENRKSVNNSSLREII